MDKKIFLKEKHIKEKALELFPECYSRSLNVSTSYTNNSLERLKKYIIEYFENDVFNPKLVDFDADKAVAIREAYDLVKKEYYREENLNFENVAIDKLFDTYNDLISSISDYRFNAHRKNSYGGNQNRSNKEILLEISMLYPVLLDTLEKADRYIVNNSDAFRLFVSELLDKIGFWTNEMKIANNNLGIAKFNYHENWNSVNKRYYYGGSSTSFDLGLSKKEWKIKRNEACHTIYEFYQDIMMINKAIDCEKFDTDESRYSMRVSEIEELYNYAMENIATGPNYYCYLTSEERIEDRNANVLKKAIRK